MIFNFTFTPEQLEKILPLNKQVESWFVALAINLPIYEINTISRVAAFLAQCAHESNDLTRLRENLNYKAASLIATWPARFNAANADQYAHNPEKIGNYVYANRMGNGDEASGDGFKYRGRGPIQITGKNNYTALSNFIYGDTSLLDAPDLLETDMDVAIKSACWYWVTNNLNIFADVNDIDGVSDIINRGRKTAAIGDAIGFDDRKARYDNITKILQG